MDWKQLISEERIYGPEEKLGEMSSFQRDYQAVLFSSMFRRLQDKTQAFPMEQDDYIRTRLTHSLEVSAVAGELGVRVVRELRRKKADPYFEDSAAADFPYILMTAGLIHDIGNPPYGHFGEYAIREWFGIHLKELTFEGRPLDEIFKEDMRRDFLTFEGNAQGLRLLTKGGVGKEKRGLNLTMTILASVIKYPVSSKEAKELGCKMGYFQAEKEVFRKIGETLGLGHSRHPLSWLLEAADDIAYKLSDLEDAAVKNVLSYEQLLRGLREYGDRYGIEEEMAVYIQALEQKYKQEAKLSSQNTFLRVLQSWNQDLKEAYVSCAVENFVNHYVEIMEGSYRGDLLDGENGMVIAKAVGYISEQFIYTNKEKIKAELFGRKVLHSLLSQFVPAVLEYDMKENTGFIEKRTVDVLSRYYKDMYDLDKDGKNERERLYLRLLMVTDFLSGMTDHYARELYEEIC